MACILGRRGFGGTDGAIRGAPSTRGANGGGLASDALGGLGGTTGGGDDTALGAVCGGRELLLGGTPDLCGVVGEEPLGARCGVGVAEDDGALEAEVTCAV